MNWLSNTIRAISPNCKEAIRLQSESLDHPLPPLRRIGLRIHLFLCVWCTRYGNQIKFLRSAAQHCHEEHDPKPALPSAARERIKHAIEASKG